MSPAEASALLAPDRVAESALRRVRTVETLEAAYAAWAEIKLEHAAARVRFEAERKRLEEQGSFLLNSLKAAGEPAPGDTAALATRDTLHTYVQQAEAELKQRLTDWNAQRTAMEASYAAALDEVKGSLRARAERFVGKVRPRLKLWVRTVGPSRRILHLERIGDDDAVLLGYLLSGTLPTRHGFLGDDSTDDVRLEPAPLYAEEGVDASGTRPTAPQLAARFASPTAFVPVKGFVPMTLAAQDGSAFYRLKLRGPVLEVEAVDGEGFTPLLPREEAERLAGHLLRLKLAGKLELDIDAG